MGAYVARPGYTVGNLVFVEESQTFNIQRGTRTTRTWEGLPNDIEYHYNNRNTSFPGHVDVTREKTPTPYHRITAHYGIDLFSVWGRQSAQHEVPLVASLMGQELDFAFPGWARFIEIEIDKHYTAQLAHSRFNLNSIKSSALFEDGDKTTPAVLNTTRLTSTALDILATRYATTYIRGAEVFYEPRYVVTNTINVSADFNSDLYPVLDSNTGKMLSHTRMLGEGLQAGEIIPAGTVVPPPKVNWWHKQPFQKQQTSENTFIVTREWWGVTYFDENLYEKVI